jgi:transposase
MSKLDLTADEKDRLKTIYKYTHNNSMRENRIRVVLAYDDGNEKTQIKKWLLLDLQTIRQYINDFKQYRMDSIDFEDGRKNRSGNKTELSDSQIEQVKHYLRENIVTEAKEIQSYCETTFNIKYSLSGITALLHRLNFTYKKVTAIPQKSNTIKATQEQLSFEQSYEQFKKNLSNNDKAYFMDGVHPTHNTKAGYAWIEIGKEKIVETNSGRDRVNINGAYDALSGEVVTINTQTINSSSTLKLFDAILKTNSNTDGDLYCFSDNARYYKSNIIQEALKENRYRRIKMIFIPTYSPNLNPIERVWKFFKKEVIENQFYKTFKEFKEGIDDFFQKRIKTEEMKEKLKVFASDNFHIRHREKISLICQPADFKYNYFGG